MEENKIGFREVQIIGMGVISDAPVHSAGFFSAQAEGVVKGSQGVEALALGDHTGDFDVGSGNHLDIDAPAGQGVENFSRDHRVIFETCADNGNFGAGLIHIDAPGADFAPGAL